MTGDETFGAPWGTRLKAMTALATSILVGVALLGLVSSPVEGAVWTLATVVVPLGILVAAAFFLIRGYVLTPEALYVKRLGWRSKIALAELDSAAADPTAMARSIRTFGNGGLFCFAGAFRNRTLGPYRAFATDLDRSVVLRFPGRTVVVTPDRPAEFVERVAQLRGVGRASA